MAGREGEPRLTAPGSGAYRAPLVVCDEWIAWTPDGDAMTLPEDCDDLPALVEWAASLGLGHRPPRGRGDAPGQVWLQPALARRLGLPDRRTKGQQTKAAAAIEAAADGLVAAGWSLGETGLGPWTRVYRKGDRSLQLVMPGWFSDDGKGSDRGGRMWEAGLPSDQLARRLGLYAAHVGVPFLLTPAVTGVDVLRKVRANTEMDREMREAAAGAGGRIVPPPGQVCEGAFSWLRQPTDDELSQPFLQVYDLWGQWLAGSSSAELGFGPPEHVVKPQFDPRARPLRPAYYLVEPGEHDWPWTMPNPFDPTSRLRAAADRRGPFQVLASSYTLAIAYELGWELQPLEGWIWPRHGRYLEPWYEQLRDARVAFERLRAAGDPDASAVLKAVKLTYSGGVGRLAKNELSAREKADPVYRRDWYHHVLGRSRANLLRQLAAAGNRPGGRWPVAVWRDSVVYAAGADDPVAAAPAGLTVLTNDDLLRVLDEGGRWLGTMRPLATVRMDEMAGLLDPSRHRGPEAFMDAIKES